MCAYDEAKSRKWEWVQKREVGLAFECGYRKDMHVLLLLLRVCTVGKLTATTTTKAGKYFFLFWFFAWKRKEKVPFVSKMSIFDLRYCFCCFCCYTNYAFEIDFIVSNKNTAKWSNAVRSGCCFCCNCY